MKMRKLFALILASAMLFSGCTVSTSDDTSAAESMQVIESTEKPNLLTHIFCAEEIVLPAGYSVNEGVIPAYDTDSGEISCAAYPHDEIPRQLTPLCHKGLRVSKA